MIERICQFLALVVAVSVPILPAQSKASDSVTILRGGSGGGVQSPRDGQARQGFGADNNGVTVLRGLPADRSWIHSDVTDTFAETAPSVSSRQLVGGETLWVIDADGTILTGCRVVNTGYVGGSRVQCSGPYYGY